jgi:acyl-coenzyme A synthetase/AMP-(fatty) acid ligase
MAQTFNGRKRVRKFFGNISEVAQMPNLIEAVDGLPKSGTGKILWRMLQDRERSTNAKEAVT